MSDGFNGGCFTGTFRGPTLRQRLLGLAQSSTLVTVIVDRIPFTGRIVSVDIDNFEMVLRFATDGLPAGSIVNISFAELDAISVP
jgi:hypothetical protein